MYRIGILGAGHIARAHLDALQRHGRRARVTHVARAHANASWPEADAVGAAVVSPEVLLASADVDAVAVCTPSHLHCDLAIAALRSGKHVFCEKPLALTVADADAMSAAAKESGRVLMVGHLTRHAPLYVAAADVLASGRLGRAEGLRSSRFRTGGTERLWRMDPRLGGGVVFDLMIHDIDLIHWFLGRPATVSATGQRHACGAFDAVRAVYTLASGEEAVVEGSFRLAPGATPQSVLRVRCERGELRVGGANESYPIEIQETGRSAEGIPVSLEDALVRGISSEWGEFIDALDGAAPARLRLEDARRAVLVAGKTVESAECDGARVQIE